MSVAATSETDSILVSRTEQTPTPISKDKVNDERISLQDKKRKEWFEYLQKSRDLAETILKELQIEATEARIDVVSRYLTSKDNSIEKAKGVKQKGLDGLIAEFIAPSITKSRFQTKISMSDATVIRDETSTESVVHYYTTAIKGERALGKWNTSWSPTQNIDEDFLRSRGIKRVGGKKMRIVLHLQYTSEFRDQSIPFGDMIHSLNLDLPSADFSIQTEQIPFSVEDVEKISKVAKKRKLDLVNPEVNHRLSIDRITFKESLIKESINLAEESRTGYIVSKNIDFIVDHVFKNLEIYGIYETELIGGYIFDALVELELGDSQSKLSQDLTSTLKNRPENKNLAFDLNSKELSRIEELYTIYSRQNGNSHADKLCIGQNFSFKKIAGLIEIKKASSSDVDEEYVSQILKSAKNLNAFINWVNTNPALKNGERLLIGKLDQAAWNNMAIFIIEPHQEGDRGNRSFRRQEFNIHLLRSIIDSKIIHEITTAVAADLKKQAPENSEA